MNMKKAVLLLLALVLVFASTTVASANVHDVAPDGIGFIAVDPTCFKEGVCRHCFEDFEHTIPSNVWTDDPDYFTEHLIDKLPHHLEYLPGEDPQPAGFPCGAQGTLVEQCTNVFNGVECPYVSGKTRLTDLLPHTFGKHLYDKEGCNIATCVLKEHYYQICEVCGFVTDILEGELDVDNHNLGDWQYDKVSTSCQDIGSRYKLCYDCRKVRISEQYTLPHEADMEHPVYVKEPGCLTPGIANYYCKYGCGTLIAFNGITDVPVEPLGHLNVKVVVVDKPTCHADDTGYGFQKYVCQRANCDGKTNPPNVTDEIIEKAIDNLADYVPGIPTRYLYNGEWCEIIDKVPHTWTDWYERNDYEEGSTLGYWIRDCKVCGKHDYKIDEDTTDKYVIDPKSIVDPTCTEDGHYDEVLYDGDGKEELDRRTVSIPALGHDYLQVPEKHIAPTCETAGKDFEICQRCAFMHEKEIPALGHTLETVPAKAPTAGSVGNEEYQICTVCKKTFKNGVEINPADMVIPPAGGLSNEDGAWKYYDENGEVMTSFTGLVNFEGGKFFVRNGVVDTTVNGVQSPDAKSFYFFANGQICSNFTGFAEYAGQWFVVKNGVLQTSYNGLYEYDGEKFWVAAGQKTHYSGLMKTEEGWLYLSNGQFYPTTDLIHYDGEIFYVKNGKLQESFTGTVKDFRGVEYNIVNGMVK